MSLAEEIQRARTEVVSDGYEMSVGEIINLYKDEELVVNPAFQRLFRWDSDRKSRFIESLLLGIPVPPIFVYQDKDGKWELIDGLQRLSTILELVGVLKKDGALLYEPAVLEGTRFLPSLGGKRWHDSNNTVETADDGIGLAQQLQIKRARIRVEILKNESDPKAKFELFQRLNTGGASLSPQEVRNCVAVMLDENFYNWLTSCANQEHFKITTDQTVTAAEKQSELELALRFFAFRNVAFQNGLNVHEYLDDAMIKLASDKNFDTGHEGTVFNRTFDLLHTTMGRDAFKRWNGSVFTGKFLMSVFEVVATGTSKNIDAIVNLDNPGLFVIDRCKLLWSDDVFNRNNGAGVRGTTRLTNLLPMSEAFFRP